MPAKTARIQSKQRCDDSGPDAVVDSGVEVEVDSVATEGPGGTDLAAAVPHATGIEISTEAGHVAGGIATVTVMTAEGPGSAHSPVEALAAVVVETETVEASAVVVVETETVEASAVVVVETETVEASAVVGGGGGRDRDRGGFGGGGGRDRDRDRGDGRRRRDRF
jgi:hypothetical protein